MADLDNARNNIQASIDDYEAGIAAFKTSIATEKANVATLEDAKIAELTTLYNTAKTAWETKDWEAQEAWAAALDYLEASPDDADGYKTREDAAMVVDTAVGPLLAEYERLQAELAPLQANKAARDAAAAEATAAADAATAEAAKKVEYEAKKAAFITFQADYTAQYASADTATKKTLDA